MLSTKENFNQLETTLCVQELDNETAATIQGGWALEVYRHANLTDKLGSFNQRSPGLSSNSNDQISGFNINAGTWRFYEHANYKGAYLELGPGRWHLAGHSFNDRISSLKRVA